jgi:hypothetical protein
VPSHLPDCVQALPEQLGCAEVREQYGRCPDHDSWCAPGCPITTQEQEEVRPRALTLRDRGG